LPCGGVIKAACIKKVMPASPYAISNKRISLFCHFFPLAILIRQTYFPVNGTIVHADKRLSLILFYTMSPFGFLK